MNHEEKSVRSGSQPPAKKAYKSPKLIDFGSVARTTKGGMNIGNDGNTNCNGNANPTLGCESS